MMLLAQVILIVFGLIRLGLMLAEDKTAGDGASSVLATVLYFVVLYYAGAFSLIVGVTR